ncbi:MAG: pilus assembly protein TadG-related protein [Alphaproteobacteria bacterium]|nr:pilus assembly protein TadG-related protein [Alphaproteobacteria bacterium]
MQNTPVAATAHGSIRAPLTSPIALATRLGSAEGGSVAAIVGLAIIPLFIALGLAVDAGMAYGAHSRLQGAVDSAVLASARAASTEGADIEADARMYFDANFPTDYLGNEVVDFDARFNEETRELTVDAEITMPTSFMRIAGWSSMPVAASASAVQQLSGIELALVLDVTGSMDDPDPSGGTKIQALKDAAGTLLDVVYGENETVPDVSISVVPYNTVVNLGSDRTDLLTGFDPSAYGSDGWKGCVEARAGTADRDDTPPSEEPFTAFLWEAGAGTGYNPSEDPNAYCPDSEVLPLTAEKSVLSAHIDGLEADGFTMTNVGFTWGWRTISPRWQGEWGSAEAPVDYDHPTINKAIIFMTDGKADWAPGYDTAYGFLKEKRLGFHNEVPAEREVNDRLLESCELAKTDGVEVYTVMFALDDSKIEADYRSCATSDAHFFDAPDGATLEAAFRDIAGRLTSLRLTQ